jgi:hypothetical protein
LSSSYCFKTFVSRGIKKGDKRWLWKGGAASKRRSSIVNKRVSYVAGHELQSTTLIGNTSSSCAVSKLELDMISREYETYQSAAKRATALICMVNDGSVSNMKLNRTRAFGSKVTVTISEWRYKKVRTSGFGLGAGSL